uniref:restriction endonuclease subunit S n=1 Tax=Alloprevotella sp. TaxID=1872471 RepID=UPI003FEF45FA
MKETKFKNTEIGEIPEDWEVRTINSFCSVKTGPFGSMLHAEDYVAKGTPIVTTEHFKNGILPLVGKDIPQVGIEDLKRMSSYTLTKDDIVFSRVGSVDINALVTVRQKGWLFSGRVLRVRPFKQTDSLYLHYGLLKHSVRSDIVSRAVGLTMASINTKILGETELSLPPLNEQHRIASALTSIDNLISSLGKLIEKKKNIKQGTMQQLLTGKTRLKGFTEPWVEKKLGDVAVNYTGLTYSPMNVKSYGTLVLRSSNIQKGILVFNDNVFVDMDIPSRAIAKKNDLLICVRNGSKALIGKSAVITDYADGMAFGAFMTILHANDIQQGFLNYLWQADYIQQQVKDNMGATINQITNADIEQFKIVVPHSLKEQQAIATILTKMDDEITALEAQRAKYEAIKQGMMQQLLTGKLRLIS